MHDTPAADKLSRMVIVNMTLHMCFLAGSKPTFHPRLGTSRVRAMEDSSPTSDMVDAAAVAAAAPAAYSDSYNTRLRWYLGPLGTKAA
jgi:hypothetical protein